MLETEDPRQALENKDVTVRAAAARDFSRMGSLDDVPTLIAKATQDRSPSVRLYTAAATASILRRARLEGPLKREVSDLVMDALRRFDPQQNPSVLLALGAVGPSVRARLGRLLKDPHSDVRMAAVAALRAEALSPLSTGDDDLDTKLATWAAAPLPPDVGLDLGRLLGEVGHTDGEALLGSLSARLRDPEGVLEEAAGRVRARRERAAYLGVWRLQQPEVLSPPDLKTEVPWVGVSPSGWHVADGSQELAWTDDGRPVGPEGPARLLFVGIPGQEAHAALQTATATRFGCRGKELATWLQGAVDGLRGVEGLASVLATQLADVEGAAAPLARALARWRAGDLAAAARDLDELLSGKKPKADLYWWRANVALSEGDLDDARGYVNTYLAKAAKKAKHREAADALLQSLTA